MRSVAPESRRCLRRGGTILATLWLIAGLLGLSAYLQNYSRTRGFLPITRVGDVRAGHLETVTFFSPALHKRTDYVVYLPTGFDPHRRYPVIYLLHGVPGGPLAFVDVANLPAREDDLVGSGRMRAAILVFPDGRIDGNTFSDSEWANTHAGPYENYVLDVVHNVDQRFPTIRARTARVIGGYSAGTTGALNLALHHPGLFATVEGWSGPFEETRSGPFRDASAHELWRYSPIEYARRLRAQLARWPLQVFLYGGISDPDSRNLPQMAAVLRSADAQVRWTFYPGGHDWQLWNGHANQMLLLASRDLSHPPQGQGHGAAAGPVQAHASATGPTSHAISPARAALGLALAFVSAAVINLGFLLQHRALQELPTGAHGIELGPALARCRTWLIGQAVGWVGFAAQIVAVAVAPLALVQAFAAGGLALSAPLATRVLRRAIPQPVGLSAAVAAVALALLPIGLGHVHEQLQPGALILCLGAIAVAGLLGAQTHRPAGCALAAGLFYGAADSAIKAGWTVWRGHGPAGALGWALLAAAGTFAGFLSFQRALRDGGAVSVISLMNIVATLAGLLCGALAFGEPIGRDPMWTAVHGMAIATVLGCVPVLADGQQTLTEDRAAMPVPQARRRVPSAV